MKKKAIIITAIVLILTIIGGVGGYFYYQSVNSPEKLILGKWEAKVTSYEFKNDGTVNIGSALNISSEGKYTIDAKSKTINITYSAFGLSYKNAYEFVFSEDKNTLTLTDGNMQKISVIYNRVAEEK